MSSELQRRSALGILAGFGAAVCPLCVGLAGRALASETAHGAAWGYEGEAGPEHWGELSADFRVCELGFEQTPIDLRGGVGARLGAVEPVFHEMALRLLNNGHTIQVNCDPGSFSTVDGVRFELVQFHFHHPSEHLLSGKAFDLECHFVHKSSSGALAVLGVFIRPGLSNEALEPIFAAMPAEAGEERAVGVAIRPAGLLPLERGFFRYNGSLTTPPCSEGVNWVVFRQPIEASDAQIRQFAGLFPVNARPVQPLNRRILLESSL